MLYSVNKIFSVMDKELAKEENAKAIAVARRRSNARSMNLRIHSDNGDALRILIAKVWEIALLLDIAKAKVVAEQNNFAVLKRIQVEHVLYQLNVKERETALMDIAKAQTFVIQFKKIENIYISNCMIYTSVSYSNYDQSIF